MVHLTKLLKGFSNCCLPDFHQIEMEGPYKDVFKPYNNCKIEVLIASEYCLHCNNITVCNVLYTLMTYYNDDIFHCTLES